MERPPGVRKVMVSIPVGKFFSLSHARVVLIISLFTLPKLFITILILFTILGLGFGNLSQMINSEIIMAKLIGHFRVPLCLCFKASLSAKPFL